MPSQFCQTNTEQTRVPEYNKAHKLFYLPVSVRLFLSCHPPYCRLSPQPSATSWKASSRQNKSQYPRRTLPQSSLRHDFESVLQFLLPYTHYKMSVPRRVHLLHRGSSRSQACGKHRYIRSPAIMPVPLPASGNPNFPVPYRSNIRLCVHYSPFF